MADIPQEWVEKGAEAAWLGTVHGQAGVLFKNMPETVRATYHDAARAVLEAVLPDIEAQVHARWHRALDEPGNEPEGPIRDHVDQIKAQAWRAGYDLHLDVTNPPLHDALEDMDNWADGLEDAAVSWLDVDDRENYDRNNGFAAAVRRHAEAIRAALKALG